MRELKFRAWDTKHKKYIWIVDLSISRIFWDYPLWDNDDYYLEQYIWIKDKNWIEIYEWDLVESLASIYPTDDTILSDWYRITTWIQKWRKVFRVDYQKNFHWFEFIWHWWYYIDSNISNREYVVVWNLRENSII